MQMYVVVDFGCNRGGDAGTLHLIDEACPKQASGRIEHPRCSAQTFPITAHVACGALNDLHMVASDDICQKRWRRGFTFGQKHGSNVEFTITVKGRQRCAHPDPTPAWDRDWDKRWRLVTFDIPEIRRKDRLTLWRELRDRRLGFLQQSVWIWPHDIEPLLQEVIQAKGIPECFAGFECTRLFLCTDAEIVETAWDFKVIRRKQETYLKEVDGIMKAVRDAPELKALPEHATKERFAYLQAIECDPWLPRVLWPKGYRGEAVQEMHQRVRAELSRRLRQLASVVK